MLLLNLIVLLYIVTNNQLWVITDSTHLSKVLSFQFLQMNALEQYEFDRVTVEQASLGINSINFSKLSEYTVELRWILIIYWAKAFPNYRNKTRISYADWRWTQDENVRPYGPELKMYFLLKACSMFSAHFFCHLCSYIRRFLSFPLLFFYFREV